MFKIRILPIAVLALMIGLSGMLLVAPSVLANEQEATNDGRPMSEEKRDERRKIAEQKSPEERKEAAKQRLDDQRLKICLNREKTINNVMVRMSNRGAKHLEVFNKISERVQAFYKNKGLNVANYETLVADIQAKKIAAEAAVAKTKASSVEFKCDGSDPKGAAQVFKDNLKAQNEALKAYKTAIRNLIVAVKSAQSATGGQQ
jgi:hypothetical protein